jgi:GTPase SAR1 family protein
LGTGGSGKSTIFKNLKQNTGDVIDDSRAKSDCADTVRNSLVQHMTQLFFAALAMKSEGLDSQEKYAKCMPDETNPDEWQYFERYYSLYQAMTSTEAGAGISGGVAEVVTADYEMYFDELGELIEALWAQSWTKQTYKMRGGRFSMPDNMGYFFPRAREIFDLDYSPSKEDILRQRVRTTGVITHHYEDGGSSFMIMDVGGQQSERSKWKDHIANIAALLFVVAMNHYNEVLFEAEDTNAMHEAVRVFALYVNYKAFDGSQVIIMFNKADLFAREIEDFPLGVCFGEGVTGWDGPEYWTGPDFAIPEGSEPPEDRPSFEDAHRLAIEFIQDVFEARNQKKDRKIFKHVTTATNPENVATVFGDVQMIVIQANLFHAGFAVGDQPQITNPYP